MKIKDWFTTKKEAEPGTDQNALRATERTKDTRTFVPDVDIYERDSALVVVADLPGVDRKDIDVTVENGTLALEAAIDLKKYDGLRPLYTEYQVGHYARRFGLSEDVDPDKISADMRDGVLTLTLPYREKAKQVRVTIN